MDCSLESTIHTFQVCGLMESLALISCRLHHISFEIKKETFSFAVGLSDNSKYCSISIWTKDPLIDEWIHCYFPRTLYSVLLLFPPEIFDDMQSAHDFCWIIPLEWRVHIRRLLWLPFRCISPVNEILFQLNTIYDSSHYQSLKSAKHNSTKYQNIVCYLFKIRILLLQIGWSVSQNDLFSCESFRIRTFLLMHCNNTTLHSIISKSFSLYHSPSNTHTHFLVFEVFRCQSSLIYTYFHTVDCLHSISHDSGCNVDLWQQNLEARHSNRR